MPLDAVGQTLRPDVLRRGELAGHGLADGEERFLQADEEQGEPQQDQDEARHDPAQVRQPAAQHDDLEQHEDADDRGHVQDGGERGGGEGVQELHRSDPHAMDRDEVHAPGRHATGESGSRTRAAVPREATSSVFRDPPPRASPDGTRATTP